MSRISTVNGEEITSFEESVDYNENLDSSFAKNLKSAYNSLLAKTNYDYNIIPFIVTTDQHSRLAESQLMGVYRLFKDVVDMQSISRFVNLGDTTADGYNAELLDAKKLVEILPREKQVNVWGNHDFGNGGEQNQGYLKKFFLNDHTTKYGGQNGYFVSYDGLYGVKYIAINNMEHVNDGTKANNSMSTQQIKFIIEELTKNDGYDIILCSHWFLDNMDNIALNYDANYAEYPYSRSDEPFFQNATVHADFLQMIADRKNKTSGTFTDDEGVTHEYDFSNCENELLISFAGHDHLDFYKHMNNSITQIEFDDFKTEYAVYFCYLDRVNKKFGWYKTMLGRANFAWEIDIN